MKIILMKTTIGYLNHLSQNGNQHAIDVLTRANEMEVKEKETYVVLTEKKD